MVRVCKSRTRPLDETTFYYVSEIPVLHSWSKDYNVNHGSSLETH